MWFICNNNLNDFSTDFQLKWINSLVSDSLAFIDYLLSDLRRLIIDFIYSNNLNDSEWMVKWWFTYIDKRLLEWFTYINKNLAELSFYMIKFSSLLKTFQMIHLHQRFPCYSFYVISVLCRYKVYNLEYYNRVGLKWIVHQARNQLWV